jgi:hypothetical protein
MKICAHSVICSFCFLFLNKPALRTDSYHQIMSYICSSLVRVVFSLLSVDQGVALKKKKKKKKDTALSASSLAPCLPGCCQDSCLDDNGLNF